MSKAADIAAVVCDDGNVVAKAVEEEPEVPKVVEAPRVDRNRPMGAAGENLVDEISGHGAAHKMNRVEGKRNLVKVQGPTRDVMEDMADLPSIPLNIVVRRQRTTTTTSTTTTTTLGASEIAAIAFCEVILNNTDNLQEQFFGNPEDCTSFYQCSLETGVLLAKLFYCQPGMFWKEQLKQCMPGYACRGLSF